MGQKKKLVLEMKVITSVKARVLRFCSGWEGGIFRAVYFLDAGVNEHQGFEKEWDEDMG